MQSMKLSTRSGQLSRPILGSGVAGTVGSRSVKNGGGNGTELKAPGTGAGTTSQCAAARENNLLSMGS